MGRPAASSAFSAALHTTFTSLRLALDTTRMDSARHSANSDDAESPAARCFVHKLPSELLCSIFIFLAEYRDRLSTAAVCHFWRDASLSSPALLWNDVVSQRLKPGVLTQMLARTRFVPARLTVSIGKGNVREVSDALKLHMFHLTHISIHISEDLKGLCTVLAAGLATPAPILESFIVMDVFSSIGEGFGMDLCSIFSGKYPRLRCLKLFSEVALWRTAPFWSELRTLLFSPIDNVSMDSTELNNGILSAKSLKLLAFDFGDFQYSIADVRIHAAIEILALCIGHQVCHDVPDFVAGIHFESLRLLTLLFPHGCGDDIATPLANDLCSRMSTESLTIYGSLQSDEMILEGASKDGRIWEMFDVSPKFTAETFAGLRSLCVSDSEWTKTASWPTAPVLTSLEIRVIAPCYMQEDGHKSMFLDVRAGGVLRCPQIDTLCFSTSPRGAISHAGFDAVLAPEMITDFLCFGLDFPRSRRPDLYLKGVTILELAIDHVARLLSCIGDIRVGPGYRPHQSEGELSIDWEV